MKVLSRQFLHGVILAALFVLTHSAFAFYDPTIGRWLSRDPIGEEGGPNLYAFVNNGPINFIDPDGLRPIDFAFNAFINGNRGLWLDQPGSLISQFKTDGRDFGQFNKDLANARVFSYGTIESTRIGGGEGGGANGANDNGFSHQRTRILGVSFIGQSAFKWGPEVSKRDPIRNSRPVIRDVDKCTTLVTFNPSAGYPFTPSAVTPNIDYRVTFMFKVTGDNQVTVTMFGNRNNFPDYEGYIDRSLVYQYGSPSAGPGIGNLSSSSSIGEVVRVINNIEVPVDCKCKQGAGGHIVP